MARYSKYTVNHRKHQHTHTVHPNLHDLLFCDEQKEAPEARRMVVITLGGVFLLICKK